MLEKPITKEEIRNAIKQLHLDKALGPDGFLVLNSTRNVGTC